MGWEKRNNTRIIIVPLEQKEESEEELLVGKNIDDYFPKLQMSHAPDLRITN